MAGAAGKPTQLPAGPEAIYAVYDHSSGWRQQRHYSHAIDAFDGHLRGY